MTVSLITYSMKIYSNVSKIKIGSKIQLKIQMLKKQLYALLKELQSYLKIKIMRALLLNMQKSIIKATLAEK